MLSTVIGDPHAKNNNLDCIEALFELVEQIGLPAIWLGDLLDTKEVIRGKCLNAIISCFQRSKLNHTVLIGNHDWFNLECKAHSLEALKLLPNVTVVDRPTEVGNFVFLPYIHDKTELESLLSKHGHPDRVLFAHLEVTEFDFGNGHVCTSGLPLSKLGEFKRVISGHFHKYQESKNLTYLGTPFSHSFGESNQAKFIGMYNSETDEFKIAETQFPRHLTYEIDCNEDFSGITAGKAAFEQNNFYRVILTGSQENIDKFPRAPFDGFNVKWITRPSDCLVNDTAIDETASNEAQFSRWATEIRSMDEETVKLGMQILEACR